MGHGVPRPTPPPGGDALTLRKARSAFAKPEERFERALPEHRRRISAIVERHLRWYEQELGRTPV
jgi:hypothetical protein